MEEYVDQRARALGRSAVDVDVQYAVRQGIGSFYAAKTVLLRHPRRTRKHATAERDFLAVALPHLETKLDGDLVQTVCMVAHHRAQGHRRTDIERNALFRIRHAALADVPLAGRIVRNH